MYLSDISRVSLTHVSLGDISLTRKYTKASLSDFHALLIHCILDRNKKYVLFCTCGPKKVKSLIIEKIER